VKTLPFVQCDSSRICERKVALSSVSFAFFALIYFSVNFVLIASISTQIGAAFASILSKQEEAVMDSVLIGVTAPTVPAMGEVNGSDESLSPLTSPFFVVVVVFHRRYGIVIP
jgi:hypothetical protein